MREVIDHVLVSEQFYDWSERRLWAFREMRFFNDHVPAEDRERSDHGQVVARFDWEPRGGQWVSESEKALTMTTPATISAEAEHRRRVEALAEQRPADGRDQHDAGARPDRVGDAHRDGLEGEGEAGDGAGVADRDDQASGRGG